MSHLLVDQRKITSPSSHYNATKQLSAASVHYLLTIRWNIVIVKTIRGYKNKGLLLKVGTPEIILSKLKIDFKF